MSKKHDRQRVFGHGRLSKLQKIKENATPIEESSFYVISLVRKSFPFDVCMFENPLPVMDFEHTYMDFEHTYKHIASICALTKIKS